jgi:hypothetical protein
MPESSEVRALPVPEEPVPWELSLQLLGLMVVVLLLGLVVAPTNDPLASFRDGRLADHASAILLGMAGALAFAAFLLQASARVRRLFWLVCACAFVFLAFDELMQFHERLEWWLSDAHLARPESLPRWNDVIVTSYGAMALLFCALAMPEIRQHRSVAIHLALGLLFFAGYAAAGATIETETVREFTEEMCKVLANTSFAIAMLAGLLSIARAHHGATPVQSAPVRPATAAMDAGHSRVAATHLAATR